MKLIIKFKNIGLWVSMLAMLPATGFAEGHGAGNGGGLVERNGKYLSFHVAGSTLHIPLVPLDTNDLPEIYNYTEKLKQIQIPDDLRYRLVETTFPTQDRRYFRARLSEMSANEIQKISEAYRKTVRNPNGKIVLAAITKNSETFLFDPYFEIKNPNSRLAVLAHESYWVLDPQASYQNIIQTEMSFESCLESLPTGNGKRTECSDWTKSLLKLFTPSDTFSLRIAAYQDYFSGRLNSLINESGGISFYALVPKDLALSDENAIRAGFQVSSPWMMHFFDFLSAQRMAHPEITFLPKFQIFTRNLMFKVDTPSNYYSSHYHNYTETFDGAGVKLWESPSDNCWKVNPNRGWLCLSH